MVDSANRIFGGFALISAAFTVVTVSSTHQHIRRIQHNFVNMTAGTITNRTNEIIGGSAASCKEFPFYAAFVPFVCGGSLISPNRVLTAAHCVANGGPTAVRIGPTTFSDGEEISVCDTVVHPDYNAGMFTNDVAILKLSSSATSATPITLNADTNYPSTSGTPLTVIGFGRTSSGGSISNVLKKLETYFVDINTCQRNYAGVLQFGTHVCADVANKGTCQGNSGGPLFDSNNVQVGVVSFVIGGCALPYPDVYAGVAKQYAWIQQQISSSDCGTSGSSPTIVGDCVPTHAPTVAPTTIAPTTIAPTIAPEDCNTHAPTADCNTARIRGWVVGRAREFIQRLYSF